MIELELTYLAKYLPQGLTGCPSKEIIDIYIPASQPHPKLRIRQNGDTYEITKKEPVQGGDASKQEEQTIKLTSAEFQTLSQLEGKKAHKIRYYFPSERRTAEIDVFQGPLKGLVVVDFEFDTEVEKAKFAMPDFCLAEITQEDFVAGGMICGKSYQDIQDQLDRFGYKKIT